MVTMSPLTLSARNSPFTFVTLIVPDTLRRATFASRGVVFYAVQGDATIAAAEPASARRPSIPKSR